MTKVYERCGGSCPDNEPTNPCADCVTHQPTEAKLNGVYCVSDDTAHVGPWTTVRACLDCGVLVSGGPTRCSYCADKITATEKQAASFAAVIEALKRRVH